MTLRKMLSAAAFVLSLVLSTSGRAAELPMTAEEFGLWRDYQNALEDPRVQKMAEKQRFSAIAKNFKVNEKKLQEAVDKGQKHGEAIGRQAEEAVRASLAGTEVAGRLKEIRVDTSAAHVIAYVTWSAEKAEAIDQEVCLVAARTQKAQPLSSTLRLEVVDPADDKSRLFEALISRRNAENINEAKIVDFASTRYMKLFEKVKRAQP
jgi:hypothetical protein